MVTAMKKIMFILVVVALGFAGFQLVQRARQAKEATPLPQPPTWQVWAMRPEQRAVRQSASFLAELQARNSASLASKLSGRISELAVRESQQVRAGDLLLRLDDAELRAGIDGLKASLAAARGQRDYSRKQLERNRSLFKTGGISRDRLEASEAAWNSAAAQVRELQQKLAGLESQLEYTRLTAPFDGVVGKILMREGDLAVPGKPILTLNSLPQKLVFSFMPGVAEIRPGQPVLFDGEALGRVATLYNDARAGLWVAEVALDRRLQQPIGSYLTIAVVTRSGSGCAVPRRALLHRADGRSVMRFDGRRFVEQPVTVTVEGADYALIEPCVDAPVAVAAESRLALLPAAGERVRLRSSGDE